MNKFLLVIFLFTASFSDSFPQKREADKVTGYWFTADKKAKMYIYREGEKYNGKIDWLKEPNEADGTPKTDDKNPDEQLRNRKIEGLEIMTGFEYDGDYEWEDGEIYDPKSGNTYSCLMELSEDGQQLEVRGYIGLSLFGRTEVWTRAEP